MKKENFTVSVHKQVRASSIHSFSHLCSVLVAISLFTLFGQMEEKKVQPDPLRLEKSETKRGTR